MPSCPTRLVCQYKLKRGRLQVGPSVVDLKVQEDVSLKDYTSPTRTIQTMKVVRPTRLEEHDVLPP